MNNKVKNLVFSVLIGLGIGIFLETYFSYSISNYYTAGVPIFLEKFKNQNTGVLIERLIYMAIGALSYFSSFILIGNKKFNFINTLIHLFLIQNSIFLSGLYLCWFPRNLKSIIFFFGESFIVYVIIYIIISLKYKYSINKINKKLKEKNI